MPMENLTGGLWDPFGTLHGALWIGGGQWAGKSPWRAYSRWPTG